MANFILTEDGAYILQEDGASKLLLEQQSNTVSIGYGVGSSPQPIIIQEVGIY